MKKIKQLILLVTISIITSCKIDPGPTYSMLEFKPCKATILWAVPGGMLPEEYQGDKFSVLSDLVPPDTSILAEYYLIALFTTEYSDTTFYPIYATSLAYWFRDSKFIEHEHNTYIEDQIRKNYKERVDRDYYETKKDGINLERIEYRINGVKSFKITANQNLWGINAGNLLNDYFYIKRFDPNVIISAPTEKLVYGFTDKDNMPEKIDEWLQLQPLVQPAMMLMFKTVPDGLPLEVQFTVEMETDDGMILKDTTRPIYITK
jgi:hypothetical protein